MKERTGLGAPTLGQTIAQARQAKGWSLRQLERVTGIHNAHLSQIESGTIVRPEPSVLWVLSEALGVEYDRLLRLAGHVGMDRTPRRSLLGAALQALGDLTPDEQEQVLHYMDELRKRREQRPG